MKIQYIALLVSLLVLSGCKPQEESITPDEDTVNNQKTLIHVVYPGETLDELARQYGVSVEDIKKANAIIDGQIINPGDTLEISISLEK